MATLMLVTLPPVAFDVKREPFTKLASPESVCPPTVA